MRILMIVGIFLIGGFIIFGKNPVREYQKDMRKMTEKYGQDELSIATNLYLERKQNAEKGMMQGGTQVNSQPTAADMKNSIQSSITQNYGFAVPNSTQPGVKVAQPDDQFEDNSINVEVTQQADSPISRQQAAARDYYPPILGAPSTAPAQKPVEVTGNEQRLRSGQVIAFQGTNVYVVDKFGNRSVMPDGTYNMMDGSQLIVTNGRSRLP